MWQLNYSGALKVYYFVASVSIPVVLKTGGVGQAVLFLNPSTYVATPSGLARTGRPLDARNFMRLVGKE